MHQEGRRRGAVPGVHARRAAEEEAVARHRVDDPRAGEGEAVHAPERRDEDGDGDEGAPRGADHPHRGLRRDAVLGHRRHLPDRHEVQVGRDRRRVGHHDPERPEDQRAGEVPLRVLHLLGGERHGVPGVVGEERLAHRAGEGGEEADLQPLRPEGEARDRLEVRERTPSR